MLPLLIKTTFLWLLVCLFAPLSQAAQTVHVQLLHARIIAAPEGMQLVAIFNARPDYHLMLLDVPPRLVIDFPQTDLAISPQSFEGYEVEKTGFVQSLNYGLDGTGGVRLVVEAKVPFKIADWRIVSLHQAIWQLEMDLIPASDQEFAKEISRIKQNFSGKNNVSNTISKTPNTARSQDMSSRTFTIVLDAGHGGFDSGAQGINGLLEKDVTLAFAHNLRDILHEKNPDFTVILTREDDRFLRLNERITIARKFHADLFISIHADSIHLGNVRGATVYTISDKASDALAKAIAENENRADLLDGLPPDEKMDVTDILLDLARRETDAMSIRFADELVAHLARAGIRLIKPSHRYAGFMVLRAPEIPSVLVELGYLSNTQDEKLIADPEWRIFVATTMAKAITEYAENRGR